jgi:hypothetical protein
MGSSLFGASSASSAAKQAAAVQAQAAAAAGQKVEGAVRDSNPQITANAANASDMALRSGGQVIDSAGQAAAGVNTAVGGANAMLDPYAQAGSAASGTLQNGLAAGGDFNKAPTMADLQIDPGYQFRLDQGQQTMERSAAARGGAVSGSALKDLTNYSQGAASQEYQNAFNRFETSTQNRFSNLNTVAGRGQQAAGEQGANLIGGAQYGGNITTDAYKTNLGANEFAGSQTYDAAKQTAANTIGGADRAAEYLTQGANARAGGIVNSANAWNQGLTGASNAAGGAGAMYLTAKGTGGYANLFKNPAAKGLPGGQY